MPTFDPKQLAAWTGGSWINGVPDVIDGISIDSRRLAHGNLFIAISGPNYDGHDFVSAAFRQGASGAVVARPDLKNTQFGPLLIVDDTAKALREMASGYRRTLDIKLIAVTGSVGKTTVKEMTAAVLSRRLATAKTIGNWNNEYGLPLSILNVAPSVKIGVFELGISHPGEMEPLCRLLRPDWGIVTAVGPVHLEFFGSQKAVAAEKAVLLKNLPGDGMAFLECGRDWFDLLRSAVSCPVISIGAQKNADYILAERRNDGAVIVLEKKSGELFQFYPPLPGEHVVHNALFAVAVARACGFDWAVIRAGLESYQPQPMRWESKTIGGVLVINDAYNANPMSMEAALRTFKEIKSAKRKWLVLAGMHELGAVSAESHAQLGRQVARFQPDGLVTVGALGCLIADAAEKAGMAPKLIFRCDNHAAAAGILSSGVREGDAILFKASRCEKLEKALEIWREMASAAKV